MTDRDDEFQALYLALRIEDQKKYYDDRRTEYEAAHRQTVVVRNALLVLAALASVAGQLTGPTVRGALAVVAAVLGALAVAVTGFEALIGFPHLTKLYTDAARNLAEAEIDWTTRTPDADLEHDVDRVEEIFTSEIGQWGQLISEAGAEAARTADGVAARSPPTAAQPEPPTDGGR
ncbi:SLATT domain-containing protein [Geodermatophilus sp. YIM 151500]|uniref:SLATT domain-containing protein n=1 Tax=Geodermatophilus sp. YIM 151500 TaxID=2984531 RepID=UPI0021E48830|nr:SLATT domain-containing protein [Geodermatophilus sp. YIM 151500]MCV2489833.1 SLATT domain-containing protein [Geodermatophilus sp. YIM 151500]